MDQDVGKKDMKLMMEFSILLENKLCIKMKMKRKFKVQDKQEEDGKHRLVF